MIAPSADEKRQLLEQLRSRYLSLASLKEVYFAAAAFIAGDALDRDGWVAQWIEDDEEPTHEMLALIEGGVPQSAVQRDAPA